MLILRGPCYIQGYERKPDRDKKLVNRAGKQKTLLTGEMEYLLKVRP